MSNLKNAVVIYHANCVDGFASAWAFHRLMEDKYDIVDYIAAKYGNDLDLPSPDDGKKYDAFILDFSFKRDTLKGFAGLFNQVTLLDHHKTAQADLVGWPDQPENLKIVFDMNRSGAGIAWDYFADQRFFTDQTTPLARPALINYIEDRDLWNFKLPWSKEVNTRISLVPFMFEAYTRFANTINQRDGLYNAKCEGELLDMQKMHYIGMIADECCRKITILGKEGLVCNAPGFFAPDLGHVLAVRSGTYGATYYHDGSDSVKFSLRSNGDYDVSEIAKTFGGGGHRNAASFTLRDPAAEDSGIIIWNGENAQGIQTRGVDATKQD